MKRIQRAAVIVSLIEALRAKDSWCGETNIQKACFFLQELTRVPLDLEFVLYKYGPYSFTLTDELTGMRADSILALRVRDPKYGPCYIPGALADSILERYPKTIGKSERKVVFVAERLGNKGVADLERVATALYVRKGMGAVGVKERANRINQLKPHVSLPDAHAAVREVDKMFEDAAELSEY